MGAVGSVGKSSSGVLVSSQADSSGNQQSSSTQNHAAGSMPPLLGPGSVLCVVLEACDGSLRDFVQDAQRVDACLKACSQAVYERDEAAMARAQAAIGALRPPVMPILRPVRTSRELRGVRREVCRQMCEGVAFLHRPRGVAGLRAVFHRNLKPSNVLIRGDTVKIAELQVRGAIHRTAASLRLMQPAATPPASIHGPGIVPTGGGSSSDNDDDLGEGGIEEEEPPATERRDADKAGAATAAATDTAGRTAPKRNRTRRFSVGKITQDGSILGGYVRREDFDEWTEYPRQLRRGMLPEQRRTHAVSGPAGAFGEELADHDGVWALSATDFEPLCHDGGSNGSTTDSERSLQMRADSEVDRLRRIGAELAEEEDGRGGHRRGHKTGRQQKYSRAWARRSGDGSSSSKRPAELGRPTRSDYFTGVQAEAEAQYRDSFSLGCLIHFVMTGGQHPYGRTAEERVRGIRCRSKPDLTGLSSRQEFAARDLVSRLMHHDHRRRQPVHELTQHVLFWPRAAQFRLLVLVAEGIEVRDSHRARGMGRRSKS